MGNSAFCITHNGVVVLDANPNFVVTTSSQDVGDSLETVLRTTATSPAYESIDQSII